jgi:PmbA protein
MSQSVDVSRISELMEVVGLALTLARAAGASQAEADASLQRGLSATVRLGEVDTIEYHRDRGLSVTAYFGQAKGSASTADLRPQAVRETVQKAAAIARHTARDEFAGLADPEALAHDVPDLDLYHPWDLAPEQAITLARDCEAAGLQSDARLKNSEGASVNTHSGVRVYGNSHGFLQGYPSTSHSIGCALVAEEGEEMQRDYWHSVARRAQGLEDAAAIGVVCPGARARRIRAFRRRDSWRQPVSACLVSARRRRPADLPRLPRYR